MESSDRSVDRPAAQPVPFFRPSLGPEELQEVSGVLTSGWLTTGPRTARFERDFAAAVDAKAAIAVNSCTAALHLAVEAMGLRSGDAVLVPTMTFAATGEVVRYMGASPILVDCEPERLHMALSDAVVKAEALQAGTIPAMTNDGTRLVGMMPVHVGGIMMGIDQIKGFAQDRGLWVVEDAAHAFPAAWRRSETEAWQQCGQGTAAATCFSFYANKTITTGEGGMVVTDDEALAQRMRLMALHGLSNDAWERYSGGRSWDYRILEPGYKYNMTDIAAAIGIHQLRRAEEMRQEREGVAQRYLDALADVEELELPATDNNRIHAWHLFVIKLRLDRLKIDRNAFIDELKAAGVGCSVHWRPLHLHPYYEKLGWRPEHCPVATAVWQRLISLPIFPGMREDEIGHVEATVRELCRRHRR